MNIHIYMNMNMPRNSVDEELKKSIEYMSDKIDELSKTKQENHEGVTQNTVIYL